MHSFSATSNDLSIHPSWARIAGIHLQDDGSSGAVWLALDTSRDVAYLYDCCIFRREVLAVIAEGLNARGRMIPVAWERAAKAMADKLFERGCNMLPEPNEDTPGMAEQNSREIWARLRSGRLIASEYAVEWLDEFRDFRRDESKLPIHSYPLMAATRHAVAMINYARREALPGTRKAPRPKVAIV